MAGAFAAPLVVVVKDQYGNTIPGATVTYTAPGTGASASTSAAAVTNAAGQTQVTATANTTAGTYTVTATVAGVATGANFALTNTAGVPSSIAVVSGSGQSATVGTADAAALIVVVKDQYGNTVPGATVTYTAPGTGASASTSAAAVTNAAGQTQVTATANTTAGTFTVTATVAGVATGAGFTLTNTAGSAASIAVVSGTPQSHAVAGAFAAPLVVVVKDQYGNTIPGATVTYTAPGTGASASTSAAAVTNAAGQTSVTATANTTAGTYTVTATVAGVATGADFALTNTAGAPASIAVVSGSGQSATVGTADAAPLVVEVKDQYGNTVPGATVTYTVPGTGASASTTAAAVTNASGQTSVTATANTTAGTYTVTATVAGVATGTNFTLTNTAGSPASIAVVSGSGQSATVGTADGAPLVVVVKDQYGNTVPGATVTYTAPGTGASASTSAAAVTNASGQTQVTATANTTAGTYTVTASVSGAATGAGFTLTNTAGAAASIAVVSGTPQSQVISTAYATPLVVVVKDQYGNTVPGAAVTYTAPATGASASLSSAAVTNASGQTSVTATANGTVGAYSVSATVSGAATPATFALSNSAGAPASISVVSGGTQSTAVLTAFGAPLVVVVRDSGNNPLAGVTVAFSRPASGASVATFTGSLTTDAQGQVSVTATANGTVGAYPVSATVAGVGTGAAFNLTNTLGAPASISVVSGTPQSHAVSGAFGAPLVVVVKDAAGNVLPGVTVTVAAPATGASATTAGTTTTDASGQVSLTATANGTAGGYSVTVSVAGVATPATFSLSNTAGTPASLAVTGGGTQSTVVLTAFAQPLVVVVKDGTGNVVPGAVVTFTAPATGASATFAGSTTSDAQGQVSVTATANAVAGGPYTVTAAVAGLSGTFSLTNTAGAPASIAVVSGGGQSTVEGTAFGQSLVVVVKDAQGNVVPNATVTFGTPSSGASATVTGTTTTGANGQVSVTATANATPGGPYQVTATVNGVATPVTFDLTNTAGAAATIALKSGGGQQATVTQAYAAPLVFKVTDGSGFPVPNAVVSFAVPTSGAGASLASGSLSTDVAGEVSVAATANTVSGAFVVKASVTGVATPASAGLQNLPGAAVGLRVVSGGTQTTAAGTDFPAPLVVEAIDAYGNPVPGAHVTWSGPSTGAGATLSSGDVVTDANGRATITAKANDTGGTYPVTAKLPGGQQADFVLTNTAANALTISAFSGTPQATTVGTAFPAPLVALVQQGTTPVANAAVTFLLPSTGASATLSALTALTDAQGHARVTPTANTRAGAYTVTASTPGSAQPAAFALTNDAGAPVAVVVDPASSPQATKTGNDFGAPLAVTVVDQYGNPVPGVTVTWSAPGTGPTATVGTGGTTTDSSGRAVVPVTASGTPGTYTVTATVAGVTTPGQFTLTNTAGDPQIISIVSGSPQSTTVATAFTLPLQVRVTDSRGAPVAAATVTYTAPSTDPKATLSASTATTDAQGLAQVNATAGQLAGRYEVLASIANGAAPARFVLTNVPGAATTIAALASATPQSTRVCTAFALPLLVTVKDGFGNVVPGTAVTFAAPASDPTATLTATPPATDSAGQASVAAIASGKVGTYEVKATVAGIAAPAVFTLTNLAGDPAAVALVSGADQSTLATTPFPNPLTVEVKDGQGNLVPQAVVTVTLPTSGPSATAQATSLTTDAQGRASTTLTANAVPGAFDAQLAVAGAATPSLAHLTITPIPTTTAVTVTPQAPTSIDAPTLTATVASDHGTPTGQVRFLVDGAEVGTAALEAGTATLVSTALPQGAHPVEAVYDAQGAFGASRSGAQTLDVVQDSGRLDGGGGCGCRSGGDSGGLSFLALGVLALLSLRRPSRRGARAAVAGLAVVGALAAPVTAQAQTTTGASLNTFRTAAAGSEWFQGDSLDLRGHLRPAARLLFDYGHNPLVVYNADGSVRGVAVANQVFLNLGGSLVLMDRFRLNLNLPVAVHSGSFGSSFNGTSVAPSSSWGLGDLVLGGDARVWGVSGEKVTVAVGASLTAPTGTATAFFGDGRVSVAPRVAVAGDVELFVYSAQVGYAFRGGQLANVPFRDELRFSASGGFRFWEKKLLVGPEVHGLADFKGIAEKSRPTALEVDLGAHYQASPDWRYAVGLGTGLLRSPGVPDFRILASAEWAPQFEAPPPPPPDRDGDGIIDAEDACPDTAGVASSDAAKNGCPPPGDRDHDGVTDDLDLCPDVPKGAHPDAKKPGCPLPDTDGDGVVDPEDQCVNVAAGPHPDSMRPGCPDEDSDMDGVFDSLDQCPLLDQGPTPDPQKLGCPAPDTDKDGVADTIDLCPTVPHGLRPDPMKLGCPLPDRDGDQVIDDEDACPDQPGSPDPDPKKNGCPGLVKMEGSKILILEPVNFATNKDVILKSSDQVLNAVANTLKAFPEVERMSIEGHTDAQGGAKYNLDLSDRRAKSVMRWLVQHGIEAGRLESHGFGQEKPIAPNTTEKGRATNRRVEFRIIKQKGQ